MRRWQFFPRAGMPDFNIDRNCKDRRFAPSSPTISPSYQLRLAAIDGQVGRLTR
jgi:hypothetical protein